MRLGELHGDNPFFQIDNIVAQLNQKPLFRCDKNIYLSE